jgi:hypothetical protein
MVVAGCVAPDQWPPSEEEVVDMAAEFGVSPELLMKQLDGVYFLDERQRGKSRISSPILSQREKH